MRGHEAEGVVDRGADVAVGGCEQPRHADRPSQPLLGESCHSGPGRPEAVVAVVLLELPDQLDERPAALASRQPGEHREEDTESQSRSAIAYSAMHSSCARSRQGRVGFRLAVQRSCEDASAGVSRRYRVIDPADVLPGLEHVIPSGAALLRTPPRSRALGLAGQRCRGRRHHAAHLSDPQRGAAVSTGVVYLLAVLLISTFWGLGLGLFTRGPQRSGVQLVPHPADRALHDPRGRELGRPGDVPDRRRGGEHRRRARAQRASEAEERRREADLALRRHACCWVVRASRTPWAM